MAGGKGVNFVRLNETIMPPFVGSVDGSPRIDPHEFLEDEGIELMLHQGIETEPAVVRIVSDHLTCLLAPNPWATGTSGIVEVYRSRKSQVASECVKSSKVGSSGFNRR